MKILGKYNALINNALIIKALLVPARICMYRGIPDNLCLRVA